MIFPVLELEDTLQVADKTRLDARKSYISPDESSITLIEIEPEAGAGYIDVTSSSYLDWEYSTAGDKTVTVRITTDGAPTSKTGTISVVSEATDGLFSTDYSLLAHEPDILNYTREGRNSFKDIHRAAQDRIVKWLDEHRIWDNEGNRLTKAAIVDVIEVQDWSKYLVLQMIFEGLSNATDDVFATKSERYRQLMQQSRNRSAIRLDLDGDGSVETNPQELRSMTMVRR